MPVEEEVSVTFTGVQLTNLGLRCTEYDQDDRPDLELEIIPVLSRLNDLGKEVERQELEGLHPIAAELTALQAPGARPRDHSDIMESQFYCPISLVSPGRALPLQTKVEAVVLGA